ncbi:hypothetical protein [Mycobacterium sp. pR1184]|uniref:hypothetical protein n=1 Tax=Mycobacterium sp. pR1184 TaxID=3238981 RepID=UPI00351B5F07
MRLKTDSTPEQDSMTVIEDKSEQPTVEANHADDCGDDTETVETDLIGGAHDEASEQSEPHDAEDVEPTPRTRRIRWAKVVAFGFLPVLVLLGAAAAGYLKWKDAWTRESAVAAMESVAAAKDSTVAVLSYQPDSVEKDLNGGRERLTGKFKDSYTQLIHDVVIPGAKRDHISAVATVPAASVVSADPTHAVALVYVDQTVSVGNDAPTDTASAVRVTLEKIGNRWLISAFDPI